jgi:hypothetical protein
MMGWKERSIIWVQSSEAKLRIKMMTRFSSTMIEYMKGTAQRNGCSSRSSQRTMSIILRCMLNVAAQDCLETLKKKRNGKRK